jgi:hypothetical protein
MTGHDSARRERLQRAAACTARRQALPFSRLLAAAAMALERSLSIRAAKRFITAMILRPGGKF